jgi:hypothetical protein
LIYLNLSEFYFCNFDQSITWNLRCGKFELMAIKEPTGWQSLRNAFLNDEEVSDVRRQTCGAQWWGRAYGSSVCPDNAKLFCTLLNQAKRNQLQRRENIFLQSLFVSELTPVETGMNCKFLQTIYN